MVLSTRSDAYITTYRRDYSWPKQILPRQNTSHGALASERIFPVQIQPKSKPSPIPFNPFLHTNEDGWIFKCVKTELKIALSDYGSRIIKATIGAQSIDSNLIFLEEPDGDKPVAQLATGEFLKHLRLIAEGKESLKIRRTKYQQNVIITSTPDASGACSLTHYGPTERAKLAQQRSKIFAIIPVSSGLALRKQIRQFPHPSTKPENKFRIELHREFFDLMPNILRQLDISVSPKIDYLPIWVIFCGVGGTNKQYFCHIVEGDATSKVYNSCDSGNPNMPVIVYGQPGFIQKDKIEEMRATFPDQHRNLPMQAAYEASPSAVPIPIPPRGTNSLRFDATPISYWSHESRSKVIYTALEELEKKGERTREDTERMKLYKDAIRLEKRVTDLCNNQVKYQAKLERDQKNGYPKAILDSKQRLEKNQEEMDKEILELQKFKDSNRKKLPHSYTSSTFQLSFGLKESFYKRLSDGGILLSESNSKSGTIDNRNDVHIPLLRGLKTVT